MLRQTWSHNQKLKINRSAKSFDAFHPGEGKEETECGQERERVQLQIMEVVAKASPKENPVNLEWI